MEGKKNTPGVMYIDLKSAFDTVPHDRLLEKVNKMGIYDKDEESLLVFLIRNAHITIGNKSFQIKRGIPQGS